MESNISVEKDLLGDFRYEGFPVIQALDNVTLDINLFDFLNNPFDLFVPIHIQWIIINYVEFIQVYIKKNNTLYPLVSHSNGIYYKSNNEWFTFSYKQCTGKYLAWGNITTQCLNMVLSSKNINSIDSLKQNGCCALNVMGKTRKIQQYQNIGCTLCTDCVNIIRHSEKYDWLKIYCGLKRNKMECKAYIGSKMVYEKFNNLGWLNKNLSENEDHSNNELKWIVNKPEKKYIDLIPKHSWLLKSPNQ